VGGRGGKGAGSRRTANQSNNPPPLHLARWFAEVKTLQGYQFFVVIASDCCIATGPHWPRPLWVRSGCRRGLPGAALARPVLLRNLVWGRFCQTGALRGLSI